VAPVHKKIVLTYLRLADMRVGLLINLAEEVLKKGIHRIAQLRRRNNFFAKHRMYCVTAFISVLCASA
jgi:hypothetical protein